MKVIITFFLVMGMISLNSSYAATKIKENASMNWNDDSAPWRVGEIICLGEVYIPRTSDHKEMVQRIFLGMTEEGYCHIQDIYANLHLNRTEPYSVFDCSALNRPVSDSQIIRYIHGGYTEYYPNGQKRVDGQFIFGQPTGIIRNWYENGQLWEETTYNNEQNFVSEVRWYENGQMSFSCSYQNGQQIGECLRWYSSGQPMGLPNSLESRR